MSGNSRSGTKPKATTIIERGRKNRRESTLRGIPKPPPELSEEERVEWRKAARMLKDAGLIDNLDKTLLATYCVTYVRWVQAEAKVKKTGLLKRMKSGYVMPNPALTVATQAMKQMLTILAELGMTPASRSRIPRQEKDKGRPRTVRQPKLDPRDLLEAKN